MKKIIITETQLKKITKALLNEQNNVRNLAGLITYLNTNNPNDEKKFGTLSVKNQSGKIVNIRFYAESFIKNAIINIVDLITNEDNSVHLKFKSGREKTINSNIVSNVINYINDNNNNQPLEIGSELGFTLFVKKV